MIFVTVGTQLPFDRLIRAMDDWAARHPETPVFAQTGEGDFRPVHMQWEQHLGAAAFRRQCEESGIIVSHAGIGSVLMALELQKPIVLVPRRAELHEHRNDHQLATAKQFEGRSGVKVVYDESRIEEALREVSGVKPAGAFSPWASDKLLDTIRQFIDRE